MSGILTITLNPAIDVTTSADHVVPGRKLRCDVPRIDPGGGGINVSRVVAELGGKTTALAAVAGATGELMQTLLADAGIDAVFLEAAGMTRESFAVHDRSTGAQYRFVLPGPEQDTAFADRTRETFGDLVASENFPYVVASGSLPQGLPDGFYGDLSEIARRSGARMIIDTSGPALASALGRGLFLIRTNDIEAAELAETLNLDPGDPEGLARSIVANGGAEVVVLTLGAEGALIVTTDRVARIKPPYVEVLSPVGAGDCFVGALSFALAKGWLIERACAYGVAAAAAAVITEATELAHRHDVDRLFLSIEDAIAEVR